MYSTHFYCFICNPMELMTILGQPEQHLTFWLAKQSLLIDDMARLVSFCRFYKFNTGNLNHRIRWFCLEDLLYYGFVPLYANHKIILTAESVWNSQYFIFYFTFPNTYPSSCRTIRGLLFIGSNKTTMNMNECQCQTHILYVNEKDVRSSWFWLQRMGCCCDSMVFYPLQWS